MVDLQVHLDEERLDVAEQLELHTHFLVFRQIDEDGHDMFIDLGGGQEGGDAGQLLRDGLHQEQVGTLHQSRQYLQHLDHIHVFQIEAEGVKLLHRCGFDLWLGVFEEVEQVGQH